MRMAVPETQDSGNASNYNERRANCCKIASLTVQ
jgi:hypothetical protein